jgi:hypothetical protein
MLKGHHHIFLGILTQPLPPINTGATESAGRIYEMTRDLGEIGFGHGYQLRG